MDLARHPVYNDSVPGVGKTLQAFIKKRIEYIWRFIGKSAMTISHMSDHTKPTSTFVGTDKIDAMMKITKLVSRLGYDEQNQRELGEELSAFLTEKLT
jgi:hypothetical protein